MLILLEKKKLTNVRSSTKDNTVVLRSPKKNVFRSMYRIYSRR